eukprot:213604-Chlamydomonas_euryale.AAC.21
MASTHAPCSCHGCSPNATKTEEGLFQRKSRKEDGSIHQAGWEWDSHKRFHIAMFHILHACPCMHFGLIALQANRLDCRHLPQARTTTVPDEGIPALTGKKLGIGSSGKAIPDFMRVEPDEQTKRMQEAKSKLIDALKPTKETIDDLQTKPGLMSSFEDPEVMAAVDEIAKNPSAMAKYQNNQKVKDFYSAMAAFTGARLEKMGMKRDVLTSCPRITFQCKVANGMCLQQTHGEANPAQRNNRSESDSGSEAELHLHIAFDNLNNSTTATP